MALFVFTKCWRGKGGQVGPSSAGLLEQTLNPFSVNVADSLRRLHGYYNMKEAK